MVKPISVSDDDLARAYLDGGTLVEVGQRFGIGAATVHTHLKKIGVPLRQNPANSRTVSDEAIIAAYLDGQNAPAIAERFGISRGTVRTVLMRHDVPSHGTKRFHDLLSKHEAAYASS